MSGKDSQLPQKNLSRIMLYTEKLLSDYFLCVLFFFLSYYCSLYLLQIIAFVDAFLNTPFLKYQFHLKIQIYIKNIIGRICFNDLVHCNLPPKN